MAINLQECEKLLTAGQDHVTQNKKVFMIGENAQYWPEVSSWQSRWQTAAM